MPRKRKLSADETSNGEVAPEVNQSSEETPPQASEAEPQPANPPRLKLEDYRGMSIWQAMERMTDDDWSDKMLYLYRVQPWTVNKHTKQKIGALHKGGFPGISKQEIERTFGGGRFRLYLKMGKSTLCDAYAEIDGKPRLTADEELMVPDAPEQNGRAVTDPNLAAVLNLLHETMEEKRDQAAAAGDKDSATAFNKSLELMATASTRANQLVAEAGKGTSLADTVATLKTLLEMAAPKGSDFTNKLMLTLLDRVVGQPAQAANPATQFKEMLESLRSFKELFPEPESPVGGNWKEMAVNAIPQVLKHLAEMVREQARRPVILYPAGPNRYVPQAAAPGGTAGAFPAGLQGPVFVSPSSDGEPGTATGIPQAPVESSAPNPQPPAPSPDSPIAPIDEIKRRLVMMYYRGEPGDVAATFVEYAAPEMYKWLEGQTVETLTPLVQKDTILGILAREEGLSEWLKELVAGIAEAKSQSSEEEREPEPQPVQ